MSSTANKALLQRFVAEVQNQGHLHIVDECLAPDFVNHSAPAGLPTTREGVKMQFAQMRAAFPDMRAEIHDQVADADKVVTRKTLHLTHLGEFMGIAPTGKTLTVEVIDIARVVDGKIVEYWNSTDRLGMLQQLGVTPAAARA